MEKKMATANFNYYGLKKYEIPLWVFIGENDDDSYFEEITFTLIDKQLKAFNNELTIMKTECVGGYYQGFQLFCKEKDFVFEYPDDSTYEYKKQLAKEIEMIKEKFIEIADDFALIQLALVSQASNGEASYKVIK
jgi:hypothetical protein